MRSSLFALLPLVTLALASPFEQIPLSGNVGFSDVPADFELDLNEMRLVQMENQEPVWMSERDKLVAKASGIKFFDITENPELGNMGSLKAANQFTYPEITSASSTVLSIGKKLSKTNMEENLRKFTSFNTRYYRSSTGRQSQEWLLSRINELTKTYATKSLKSSISITEFAHSWGQNSIVASINGTGPGVVILGAHQDSTNMFPWMPAPGADDDGSGTVTILEAYRALIEALDTQPTQTVEFHWYSAEEGGLLGSQALAKSYEANGVNVTAMSQFDMTAWVKKGTEEAVGIITDYVDVDLTNLNKKLVETYLDIPYVDTKCGYACSDHASWSKAGYKSIFTIESKFEDSNKNIHTGRDTIDISDEFSFDHMLQFGKLAVAFAIEVGGWK